LLVALIAVDSETPVRKDTRVGVETQGIMGGPVLSLTGGFPEAAALKPTSSGEPPLLVADPSASASLAQTAREALNRLDSLVGDNSAGLRDLVTNLDTFSQALGRNSGRADTILAGLEKMLAPAGPKSAPETFDLAVPQFPPPRKPLTAQWDQRPHSGQND
jgi:phospholipid/cholesterol/gamma-HCH transport system substrate-binding protein